jgi:hypothetical protein
MFFFFLKNNQKRLVLKIASIVELFAFLVLGGISVYLYTTTNTFLSHASHAQGTVIDLLQHNSSEDSSVTYYPEIKFIDKTGRSIEFYSNYSSNPPDYVKGDKVNLLYDPQNPRNAKVVSFTTIWLLPLVTFIVSIISLLISCGFYFWSKHIPIEAT